MTLKLPSKQAFAEWKDSPVTQAIREAMERVYRQRRRELLDLYWQGNPAPDSLRLALLEFERFHSEFFEADRVDVDSWLREKDPDE